MAVWAVAVSGVLAGGAFLVRSSAAGVSYAGDLREGGTLEELTLPSLEDRGPIDYGDLSDRPLVINFFASWCPACIAEMPGFEQVHRRLGDRVQFLGVSQSDTRSASLDLAHETGITYPTGYDANGAFFRAAGGSGMPTTLFVMPGGRIVDVYVGAIDPGTLESLIAANFGIVV
ncbi:MAG: TlpA family protein disulfide reductase [Actinobacteria bacterium]|nr:TlpA family protein disulfide reductase [Actinomycetota bacterium]